MKTFRFSLISIISVFVLLQGDAIGQTTARLQAEKLFVEAQKALTRGDTESAESLLMQALQRDSGFTSAIWQLAQIYESRGQLAHARELILRGLTLEPNAAWASEKLTQLEKVLTQKLLSEAESYMRAGKYDLAIPKLSLYLGIKPYDPIPLIQLGRCHLAMGNLETAKEYIVQASERDPTDSQVTALLSEIEERITRNSVEIDIARAQDILMQYTPERETEARAVLETILAKKPGHTWAREKIRELDLLSAKHIESEKEEETPPAISTEPAEAIRSPLSHVRRMVVENLFIVLLVVVAVLLSFDLRCRFAQRTYPLQGSLSLIPIIDIVSLLNGNLKTGRLMVTNDESRGEIFFDKGEIVHARWKSCDGKKAFHALMDQTSGWYSFSNRLPKVRHTISEPLSILLLSKRSREESDPRESDNHAKRHFVTTAP
jgi:tetratricopeptide (TPR) repeat protein